MSLLPDMMDGTLHYYNYNENDCWFLFMMFDDGAETTKEFSSASIPAVATRRKIVFEICFSPSDGSFSGSLSAEKS
jgi:hypothetical protein